MNMRRFLSTLLGLFVAFALYGQDCSTAAWINEFHYDNDGGDVGEFVEVVLAPGLSAADYEIQLYNGSNGTQYGSSINLSTASMTTDAVSSFQIFVINYPSNGLQNGSPDGIALVSNGAVVEFLSYEGSFTATNGDVNGTMSTDIGVSESSNTPVGSSLQRNGTGNTAGDFTFSAAAAESPGALNTSQTITTCTPPPAPCPDVVWINEFHYDNDGGDVDEFVEVAGNAGLDLTGYSLVFYNGSNGTVYRTENLSGVLTDQSSGFGFNVTTLPSNGIQNGGPDGIALVDNNGNLIEFLSYEGAFTATGGPADGMTSTDVGVSEPSNTPVGFSLQRTGTGNTAADFTFVAPMAETPGAPNTGQTFTTCTPPPPGCNITLINVTEPECQLPPNEGQSSFEVTFNVTGGSGQYLMINPDNNNTSYGTSGGPGGAPTDGIVSFSGGASAAATPGTMATVRLQNSIDGANCNVEFTINVPFCPDCPYDGDAFINEFHYDNTGTDEGEFIEVAVSDAFLASPGADLSKIEVILYNGSPTQLSPYGTPVTLDMFTAGASVGGFTHYYYDYPSNGIQNGAPDGIVLACTNGAILEFLSYEGTFTAGSGPAAGMTSTDIGVEQAFPTQVGASLQLIGGTWFVTCLNTKGEENVLNEAPDTPTVDRLTDESCVGTRSTVRVVEPDPGFEIHWFVVAAPVGASFAEDDILTADQIGPDYRTNLDANGRRMRIRGNMDVVPGTYQFRALTVNQSTGCQSIFTDDVFEINIYEQPTVDIAASPDGDLCLNTLDVQYNANVNATDGGTYSYVWCAYNSGDGSGTCFNGFSDNTAQSPTRSWTTSAGPKSVGVTVESDVSGCTAEALYSFEVVAPTMVACPGDQNGILITDDVTFDCAAEVTWTNPSVAAGPCDPVTLTISVDGGAPETVTPGADYTATFDDLGVYSVSYTLVDAVGNTSTCSFMVSIDGLPCGWVDNGGINCSGSNSSYDQALETFQVTAGNCAPAFPYQSDATSFVFTELCGDGEIIARVDGIAGGQGFAGVMARDSEAPNAPKVSIGTNTINRVRKEVRVQANAPAFPQAVLAFDQFWVRITRTGPSFRAFASADGVQWFPYIFQNIQMGDCIKVGLFAYNEKANSPITATFSNVSINGVPVGAVGGSSTTTFLNQDWGGFEQAEQAASLGIYPNPAVSQITLDMSDLQGQQADIRIFNQMGQLMLQTQIDEVQFEERLDVSTLEMGVYNVVIKAGDTIVTERLVIARP
jgi:hypothetical protein